MRQRASRLQPAPLAAPEMPRAFVQLLRPLFPHWRFRRDDTCARLAGVAAAKGGASHRQAAATGAAQRERRADARAAGRRACAVLLLHVRAHARPQRHAHAVRGPRGAHRGRRQPDHAQGRRHGGQRGASLACAPQTAARHPLHVHLQAVVPAKQGAARLAILLLALAPGR
eukprot:483437-Prymnesium_polylepis.2